MKLSGSSILDILGQTASDLTFGYFRTRAVKAVGRAIKEKLFEGTCGTVDFWLQRRYAIQFDQVHPAFRVTLIRATYKERDLHLAEPITFTTEHAAMDDAVRRISEVAAFLILGESEFVRRHGHDGSDLANHITQEILEGASNWERERRPNMEYALFQDAHHNMVAHEDLPARLTEFRGQFT